MGFHRYESNFFSKSGILKNSTPKSLSEDPDVIIEVAIRAVDMDSWARLLCYPRGSFYPLSSVLPMKDRRIIKTYFRTCSSRHSRSQAGLSPLHIEARCPSVLSQPLCPCVTLWQGTAPVKLPTKHVSFSSVHRDKVRFATF